MSRSTGSLCLGLMALVLFVAGCSGGGAATADSGVDAYARGRAAYDDGKYARAIEYLRTALDFGRTSEVAADAQLYLARAYRADRQYLLAGNEYTRFIEFYRNDERLEEAAYERIQAYASLSPRYELDQTPTYEAIRYIQQYARQYPASPNVTEAEALLGSLREKLARKQYEAGHLYERREMYEAAVLSFGRVLTEYPSSAYADDALLGQIQAQISYAEGSVPARQAERFQEALRLYDQFLALFPASPLVRDAEALYDRAYRGLQAAQAATADATASTPPTGE